MLLQRIDFINQQRDASRGPMPGRAETETGHRPGRPGLGLARNRFCQPTRLPSSPPRMVWCVPFCGRAEGAPGPRAPRRSRRAQGDEPPGINRWFFRGFPSPPQRFLLRKPQARDGRRPLASERGEGRRPTCPLGPEGGWVGGGTWDLSGRWGRGPIGGGEEGGRGGKGRAGGREVECDCGD